MRRQFGRHDNVGVGGTDRTVINRTDDRADLDRPTTGAPTPGSTDDVEGTIVRFTSRDTQVDVTIVDNPTARDFLSMLPLILSFEEFNGR